MAKVSTFTEDFPGSSIDTTKWPTRSIPSPATAVVGSGILTITPNTRTVALTSGTYDLADSSLILYVAPVGTSQFRFYIGTSNSNNAAIAWNNGQGFVSADVYNNGTGVGTGLGSGYLMYDGSKPWFRIRHVTGQGVYLASSADGSSWADEIGPYVPTWSLSAVNVQISAFCPDATGTTVYDKINLIPTAVSGGNDSATAVDASTLNRKEMSPATDAVSGSESSGTLVQSVSKSDSETGAVSDAVSSVLGQSAGSDTGSSGETTSLTANTADMDSVSGTDTEVERTELLWLADTDTGAIVEDAGSVSEFYSYADSDAGSLSDDTAVYEPSDADSAASADAETFGAEAADTDTGDGTESGGMIALSAAEDGSASESDSATADLSSTDSGSSVDVTTVKGATSTDAGTGIDALSAKGVTVADTVSGLDATANLTRLIAGGTDARTSTEATKARTFTGEADARSIVESAGSVSIPSPTLKSDGDTATGADAHTLNLPGTFSQIPSPKTWNNGDDLDAGSLNKEWRDTFLWLLRKTSPGFGAYNATGLTLTSGTPIPLTTETLKRGNLTHATNASRIYVWETGWYLGTLQIGMDTSGVSSGGTLLTSQVLVNGSVRSVHDTTRKAGGYWTVGHMFSISLTAGDYVEVALAGSWGGSIVAPTDLVGAPRVDLFWRSN